MASNELVPQIKPHPNSCQYFLINYPYFAKGKWRLGDIPVERLIGPGIVIDISERAK